MHSSDVSVNVGMGEILQQHRRMESHSCVQRFARYLIASIALGFAPAAQAQSVCVQGTLQYYLNLASTGCRLGTVVFAEFGQPFSVGGIGAFKPWVVGPNGGPLLTPDDILVIPMVVSATRVRLTLRPSSGPLTLAAGGSTGRTQDPWDWGIGFLATSGSSALTGMTWSGQWSSYAVDNWGKAAGYSEAAIGSAAYAPDSLGGYYVAQFASVYGSSFSNGDYSYSYITPTLLPSLGSSRVYWHASAAATAGGGRTATLDNPEFVFDLDVAATTTPEPSTLSLLLVGLSGLVVRHRRRRGTHRNDAEPCRVGDSASRPKCCASSAA